MIVIFGQVGGSIAGKDFHIGEKWIGCAILIHCGRNTHTYEFIQRNAAIIGRGFGFLS